MKALLIVFALILSAGFSQAQTTDFVIARTGVTTDSPHVGTYHYLEFFQARGKWICPDVGYVDFATSSYREVFIGAGRTLRDSKRILLIEELYFDQSFGPAAKNARYLQPWTLLQIHLTPKWTSHTVCFPYLPLNNSARIQHVLEHTKVEYTINKTWKVGGGYAGYKYGDDNWQNKPLATTTISTREGSFEFWLQKMPGGAQVQLRYEFVHPHAKK